MTNFTPRNAVLRGIEFYDGTYDFGLRIGELMELEEDTDDLSAVVLLNRLQNHSCKAKYQHQILKHALYGGGFGDPLKCGKKAMYFMENANLISASDEIDEDGLQIDDCQNIRYICRSILAAALIGGVQEPVEEEDEDEDQGDKKKGSVGAITTE